MLKNAIPDPMSVYYLLLVDSVLSVLTMPPSWSLKRYMMDVADVLPKGLNEFNITLT